VDDRAVLGPTRSREQVLDRFDAAAALQASLLEAFGLIALLVAGASGLLAVWILPQPKVAGDESRSGAGEPATVAEPQGAEQEREVLVRYAAPAPPEPAAAELVEFCSKHVTERRCFVLFGRGSCVLVSEPSADPVADAIAMLKACADSSAPFIPEQTRDGGIIISFKEPVFHRFSSEVLDDLGPWPEQVAPALLSLEETMSAGTEWNPPYHARVGLLARRRMREDAATPVALRVIRSKAAQTASF